MSAGIVTVEVEDSRVVALCFVELRLEEVPHQVVGSIDATRLQPLEGWWEVEVLLIEEGHFGRHIGDWVAELFKFEQKFFDATA
jgi:hypothetical protein